MYLYKTRRRPKSAYAEVANAQIPASWEKWVKTLIFAATGLLLLAAFHAGIIQKKILGIVPDAPLGSLWLWTLAVYGTILYGALVWRIWLWLIYRPMAPVPDEELPTLSIIIPAYNEEALVRRAIESAAASDYPRAKLQIIAVDDGSSDDTWDQMKAAAAAVPVAVTMLRHPVNKGKRHALYTGFQKATGEVWATVDSDSVLEPEALRNGVAPLIRDPRIGLVAGNVRVLNRKDSLITRMLKISFTLSFTFSRAYQSRFRGLLTTPGALSIYRASSVRPVLEKWLNQTFLGVPCLTGEDRAMTNLICARGYHSFFQSTAVVWAQMPSSYVGMAKMFLRWARSNIRETVVLLGFLFTPFRKEHVWAFRINSVLIASTLVIPYLLLLQSYYYLFSHPLLLLRYIMAVVIMSIPMAAIYFRAEKDSDAAWVVVYEIFWFFACQWIMPYAFFTCRRQGAWITRGQKLPVKTAAPLRARMAVILGKVLSSPP